MIQFEPPTEADLVADIGRTQGILDRIFGQVSTVIPPDRTAEFERAIEDLAVEGRALLEAITKHPRYNENEAPADDLIRFLKAAAAIARELRSRHELHPNSTFLRALERSRKVEDAAQEVFAVQPRPLTRIERVEAENDRRDAIDAKIAREAFEAAIVEQAVAEPPAPEPPPETQQQYNRDHSPYAEPDVDDEPWSPPNEDEEDLADALTRYLNQPR